MSLRVQCVWYCLEIDHVSDLLRIVQEVGLVRESCSRYVWRFSSCDCVCCLRHMHKCCCPFRSSSLIPDTNSDTSVLLTVRNPSREEDVQNYDPRFRLCELVFQRRVLLHRVHGKSVVVTVGHTRHTSFLVDITFSTWATFVTHSMHFRHRQFGLLTLTFSLSKISRVIRTLSRVNISLISGMNVTSCTTVTNSKGFSHFLLLKSEFTSKSRRCTDTISVRWSRRLSVWAFSHDHGDYLHYADFFGRRWYYEKFW